MNRGDAADLFRQGADGAVEAAERQREHARLHKFGDHAGGLHVHPAGLGRGDQPGGAAEVAEQALQSHRPPRSLAGRCPPSCTTAPPLSTRRIEQGPERAALLA